MRPALERSLPRRRGVESRSVSRSSSYCGHTSCSSSCPFVLLSQVVMNLGYFCGQPFPSKKSSPVASYSGLWPTLPSVLQAVVVSARSRLLQWVILLLVFLVLDSMCFLRGEHKHVIERHLDLFIKLDRECVEQELSCREDVIKRNQRR